jgi:hypothetical protein
MERDLCCLKDATQTRRHLQMDGFPNEWEMKNSLSNKAMMLVTSVLIGGMLGGCISVGDRGGALYITVSALMASGFKSVIHLSLSIHGNGSNLSLSSNRVGKWKSLKLPWQDCRDLKLSIPASL